MKKYTTSLFAAVVALSLPTFASAQALSATSNINDVVAKIIGFFNVGIFLIIAFSVLVFIWNVYQYFIVKDPENKKEAGTYVMYSVIGMFVILSFWGLVNIVSKTLNLNTTPGSINVSGLLSGITSGTGGGGYTPTFGSYPSSGGSYSSGIGGSTNNSFFGSGSSGGSSGNSFFGSGSNGGSSGNSFFGSGSSGGSSGNNYFGSGSTGGTTVNGINSNSLAQGSNAAAYQKAYQANATSLQQGLVTNNCYTSTGGIVNTDTCKSLYSAYTAAQAQASQYGAAAAAGVTCANCDRNGTPYGTTPALQAAVLMNQLVKSGCTDAKGNDISDNDPDCVAMEKQYDSLNASTNGSNTNSASPMDVAPQDYSASTNAGSDYVVPTIDPNATTQINTN